MHVAYTDSILASHWSVDLKGGVEKFGDAKINRWMESSAQNFVTSKNSRQNNNGMRITPIDAEVAVDYSFVYLRR
jgi:hypothetical protein